MAVFLKVFLSIYDTTKIQHPDVEERVAIAEIPQVDEIMLVSSKDGIGKLEIAMDGGVTVGDIGDELRNFVFLVRGKKRVLFQKAVVLACHILKLRGVDMGVVQLKTHLCELFGILWHVFRMFARST